mgnify:CR=1 FL=1
MTFDIRRWGVGQLVGSWLAYWAVLAAAKLSPFARRGGKLAQGPGAHGTASLAF